MECKVASLKRMNDRVKRDRRNRLISNSLTEAASTGSFTTIKRNPRRRFVPDAVVGAVTVRVEDLTRRLVEGGASRRLVGVHEVRDVGEELPGGLSFSTVLDVV